MEFKDHDTPFEAEIMLRKLCKVNCSVPYPKKLRTMLNEIVTAGKSLEPNCFIRVKINNENLTIEAHAKTASGWLDLGLKKSISYDILDNSSINIQMTVDEPSQIS
jgi:hypothetical protein